MDRRQKIIIRFIIVFLFITIGFVAVVGQILLLQTKERQQWIDLIAYQEPIEVPVRAVRGNIYDAEGRLLAGSMPKYVLAMDMRTQALHQGGDTLFNNNVDSIAQGLADIFADHSATEYKNRLNQAFRSRKRYYKLQSHPVSYTELKQVKQLPVLRRGPYKSGLQVEERHQRVKPFGTLASRSIGSVNQETGEGRTGLESSFDHILSGTPGLCQRQRVQGRIENIVLTPARDGDDLITTIDANLQDLAESTLRQRLQMVEGEWGCCILMEVKTGEIKAISNLDRTSSGDYIESGQHALQRMEPGSTFKTISLMACLEDGNLNYNRDTFHVFRRGWDYYGLTNTDAHAADTIYSVRDAMASSSNIALAKMVTGGFKGNAKDFVERVRGLGVADSIPFDILGSQTPLLRVPNDKATLARMSYGYSVEMSPLQVLTIYNAIANGGRMIQPILVKEIRHGDHTVERFEAATLHHHICSDRTLREVQECLHAVVWDQLGTASTFKWGTRKAQSDIVHIAGKTGTAQIFEGGRYNGHHHRISFVGYFPEEAPEYSCICVIHHPHKYGYYDAGGDCGQAVRDIAERTMAYRGSHEVRSSALPYDSIRKPHIKAGHHHRAYAAARGAGIELSKSKEEWTRVSDDSLHVAPMHISKDLVPNVVGMGAREAVYAIEQTGMIVRLTGRGRVVRQSIAGGSKPIRGATVLLELR